MTIKLFTNKLKKTCEGRVNEEVDYCEYFGSIGCGSYGSCSYRNKKILEYLTNIWAEASEEKPHRGQLLRARDLGVLV